MKPENNGQESRWLRSLFERLETPLVRYASRLVGDVDRGRDIVQDAFLRLCQDPSVAQRDYAAAWLYKVCRNRALDVRKKEQRMSSLPLPNRQALSSEASDPAMLVQRQEAAGNARLLMQSLPEQQQEVLRLKIDHGLTYREISKITDLSISNVGYLLHQGLQTLRSKLESQRID